MNLEHINALAPLDIVKDEMVKNRFVQIYDAIWGGGGEKAYAKESVYFSRKLEEDDRLQKATKFSIFTTFIDLAVSGLSLEPGSRALCYLMGRNYCIGQDDKGKKIYEGRLTLTVSGYGELLMRVRSGQIRYADNPVLVYEEDEFSYGDRDGRKTVNYTCHFPHKSGHIVACYLRITRADGSVDYSVMLEEDWKRLEEFSARNNRKWNSTTRQWDEKANELYGADGGGIDSGFLMAKCIKHAFRTYPKVRVGRYTSMESEQTEDTMKQVDDFYGVGDVTEVEPEDVSYGPEPDHSAGVSVASDNDDAF